MIPKLVAAALAAGLAVAGCQERGGSASPTPTATVTVAVPVPVPVESDTAGEDSVHKKGIDPAPDPSVCGADQLGPYLNLLPTATAREEIAKTVGHTRIRYLGPDDAADSDFRPDRLTAQLGVDGRIKAFRCG